MTAAIMLLDAGCETVHYELRPPHTDAGRSCVTQCAVVKEICRGNELRRMRMNLDACERRADGMVRACLFEANGADGRKVCELNRPPCWAAEEAGYCEGDYRACYVQCGGSVDRLVTPH